ncbi:MAG: hypothetical protein ACRCUJ_13070, partial [Phocaeicola sp.]
CLLGFALLFNFASLVGLGFAFARFLFACNFTRFARSLLGSASPLLALLFNFASLVGLGFAFARFLFACNFTRFARSLLGLASPLLASLFNFASLVAGLLRLESDFLSSRFLFL